MDNLTASKITMHLGLHKQIHWSESELLVINYFLINYLQ